jgi:type II secretory ATPase GspE/PulE/Tfp pilus assembly ATPase PilB-like protein
MAFSPTQTDLILDVGAGSSHPIRVVLPCEQLTYIGFHHGGTAPPAADTRPRVRRKIHLPGARAISVEVEERDLGSRLGFYARPVEVGGPFAEIFFYAGGVNAIESDDQLSTLLVEEGGVPEAELNRGIEEHASRQSTTLGQILIEQKVIAAEVIERAIARQPNRKLRLGEVLIEQGLATREDISLALAEQKRRHTRRLGEVLVDLDIVSEQALARVLAKKFSLPFVDLDTTTVDPAAVREAPLELLRKHRILPIQADEHEVTVAIADPMTMEGVDQVRSYSKKRIREVVVVPSQLKKRLCALSAEPVVGDPPRGDVESILDELAATAPEALLLAPAESSTTPEESDSAIIKLANQIIVDAVSRRASDIHIEPNGDDQALLVRLRVDGNCQLYRELPSSLRLALVARLKIMARLDISEKRKPQDGKIQLKLADQTIELRVATLPTVNGNEDLVLRILAASRPLPLDRLGLNERNREALLSILERPYGLILCVGPTGSGKTTTLHSTLGELNRPDTKIWTAEDPVEITQLGLRQVQVNPRIGFTFAAAMRAFLRADPDVIMVGEMRDHETAATAVEASLTGHLVLSTLHTNNAPETVTRLLDMGLDPFAFSDSLLGVLAQRLCRKLCPSCREVYEATSAEWAEISAICSASTTTPWELPGSGVRPRLFRAGGCEACGGTGYQGRIALHELLIVDEPIRKLVATRSPVIEIRKAAVAGGMRTLVLDGLDKVIAGMTDWRQVCTVAR